MTYTVRLMDMRLMPKIWILWGYSTVPSGVIPDEVDELPFNHQPHHDVQSMFWLLFTVLLRAQPSQDNIEKTVPPCLSQVWKTLVHHQINDRVYNPRGTILAAIDIDVIREALHPNLISLAPFVFKLLEPVRPEYALLEPRPSEADLHQAFWRLLLQQIVDMGDKDICLAVLVVPTH